ncbi:hypothetical protein [Persicitalea jodogahamensis]|uniref:Lipoprotein n=1 Tax=Persicitalea jodogahamensis TaxID=402147 RepID=A0A8J3D4I1_9BACT|nr:hypothetical protein [Persicitalea jodogahamensis]GHB72534.1 hypothetical protein GCM10007390_28250 [Persicitalea jodogahamensis]
MNYFRKALALLLLLFLSQCATTLPSQTTKPGGGNARVNEESTAKTDNSTLDKGCPLDKMQWLYVNDKFDAVRQSQLADTLAQAARTDAATLDRMAANRNNNPMEISSALKTLVEKMAESRVPVNEEFYKQYSSSRMAMCAVIDALRSGSIKQDESSKVAGNTFREVAKSFESLKTN